MLYDEGAWYTCYYFFIEGYEVIHKFYSLLF